MKQSSSWIYVGLTLNLCMYVCVGISRIYPGFERQISECVFISLRSFQTYQLLLLLFKIKYP